MNKSALLELASSVDSFRHYWFGRWVFGPISGLAFVTAAALRALAKEKGE